MPDSRLLQHYEQKYAREAIDTRVRPLPVHQPWPANRHEAAIRYLAPLIRPASRVLEFGAGDGLVGESLRAGGAAHASYTLADISASRLAGLRRNLTDDRYRFVCADADHPAEGLDGTFDVVIMVALIEHLIDPIRALTELRSLVADGGVVYLDTPNIAKWTRRLKLAAGRFPSTASTDEGLTTYGGRPTDLYDEGHLHYFTHRSLRRVLVDRCGFRRVTACPYNTAAHLFGRRLGTVLCRARPSLFSELACLAWR